MGPPPRRTLWSRGRGVAAVLALSCLILPVLPNAVHGTSAASPAPLVNGIQARVTWDGTDIRAASQPSSALTVSFGSTVDLRYTWASTGGAAPADLNISTARLQLLYFGLPLSARDVTEVAPRAAPNGTFDMQWDPGVLRWLLEGAYELTASLIAPNGTTMWSEPFYIHAVAPYSLLAAIPILLIVIAVYEVYAVAVSGRRSRPLPRSTPRAAKGTSSKSGTSPDEDRTGPDSEER